ncbi:MAG: PQQ-like beta-propeller repeat protein [Candidatus Marinimicrobia bacterium]|nr:PQQ-like beta-propeller repeat protein [Candidatus Neomarinimicrobiota bacterium]MBL7010485.1 PQQ-like beta-propeller repeat protein [Candidatus Neomarinimicrobiota bacterium]MBL7030924.1 PQQ-like beta-propeller repeat protein [Candidatus Neomarinimicrobiota bacterium]
MKIKFQKILSASFIIFIPLFFAGGCSGSIIWPDKISPSKIEKMSKNPVEIWTKKQPAAISGLESSGNNILLITSHRGHVYLVDSNSGNRIGKIWQPLYFDISSHVLNSSDGHLFIASRRKHQVVAHDISRGKTLWKKKFMNMQEEMIAYDNKLYLSRRDGTIIALDKKRGKQILSLKLDKPIDHGLIIWKNQIILTTLGGKLIILSPELKKIKSYDLKLCSSPIITPRDPFVILVNCDGKIILLDQDGNLSYPFENLGYTVYSPPKIVDQTLIISRADGEVMALDLTSGKMIWEFTDGNGLTNLPVQTTEDQVIIPYNRGTIVSLDIATGVEKWRYEVKHPIRHIQMTSAGLIVMDSKKNLSLIK